MDDTFMFFMFKKIDSLAISQRILNSRERKCGMAHNLKKWKQSRILMLGS